MGYLAIVVLCAVIAFFLFKRSSSKEKTTTPKPKASPQIETTRDPPEGIPVRPLDYVKARWREAEHERDTGALSTFPDWFFDPVTPRQLERLKKDGTAVSGGQLSKGAASDLIGLKEPLEEDDVEVLKFFKVPLRGMSQTLGRYEVKRLLSTAENLAAWESRPAEPMQREYLKFYGLAVPKALTRVDAAKAIAAHQQQSRGKDSVKDEEWSTFESVASDLMDRETREDYDIKKPTLSSIRDAIAAVRARGEDPEDLQLVVDQLLETKPELSR